MLAHPQVKWFVFTEDDVWMNWRFVLMNDFKMKSAQSSFRSK